MGRRQDRSVSSSSAISCSCRAIARRAPPRRAPELEHPFGHRREGARSRHRAARPPAPHWPRRCIAAGRSLGAEAASPRPRQQDRARATSATAVTLEAGKSVPSPSAQSKGRVPQVQHLAIVSKSNLSKQELKLSFLCAPDRFCAKWPDRSGGCLTLPAMWSTWPTSSRGPSGRTYARSRSTCEAMRARAAIKDVFELSGICRKKARGGKGLGASGPRAYLACAGEE